MELLAVIPLLTMAGAAMLPVVIAAIGSLTVAALIAAGIALLTLAVQKVATDNRRLLEAKRTWAGCGSIC